jgi:hypothetical protein
MSNRPAKTLNQHASKSLATNLKTAVSLPATFANIT